MDVAAAAVKHETTNTELDLLKQQMHERSVKAGELTVVGPLAPENSRGNWTAGHISLADRLETGELSTETVTHALGVLAESYVQTHSNVGAQVRCIDGRQAAGYDDNDAEMFTREQGPQIPGGSPIQAVAYRLAFGGSDGSYYTKNLGEDMHESAEKMEKLGFLPGDHIDDKDRHDGTTGCRAIDGVEEHTSGINFKTVHEVESVLQALMGNDFNARDFDHVIASSMRMAAAQEHYFIDKKAIIKELVEQNPDGAPVLVGDHKEIIAAINLCEGETLHRDHFSSRMDGQVQVFGYDAWYTFKAAKALFPYDLEQQSRYIHARLALAVTALMDLTDGSLQLVVRTPKVAA